MTLSIRKKKKKKKIGEGRKEDWHWTGSRIKNVRGSKEMLGLSHW